MYAWVSQKLRMKRSYLTWHVGRRGSSGGGEIVWWEIDDEESTSKIDLYFDNLPVNHSFYIIVRSVKDALVSLLYIKSRSRGSGSGSTSQKRIDLLWCGKNDAMPNCECRTYVRSIRTCAFQKEHVERLSYIARYIAYVRTFNDVRRLFFLWLMTI